MVPFPRSLISFLILQYIADRLMPSSFLFASKSFLNSFQSVRTSPLYDLVGFGERCLSFGLNHLRLSRILQRLLLILIKFVNYHVICSSLLTIVNTVNTCLQSHPFGTMQILIKWGLQTEGIIDRGKSLCSTTVKPEITHTLSGHQILWVITGYGLSQV